MKKKKIARKSCQLVTQRWKLAALRAAVANSSSSERKMARRCSRATSRLIGLKQRFATFAVWLCFYPLFPGAAEAGLYTASDQITLITPENVDSVLVNSTAAVVAEFYASWCGHCIGFSPVYKSLARDVKGWCGVAAGAAAD